MTRRRSTGDNGGRTDRGDDVAAAGSANESLSVLAFTSHRPAELVEPLRETDLDVDVVEIDGGESLPARALAAVRRTRASIRTTNPDVILLDCYEAMGALVALLAMRYDVPIVARLVGDTWQRFENAIRDARSNGDYHRALIYRGILAVDEFAFDRAVGFVVVSAQLGEVVRRRTGCPPERIGIVPVPDTGAAGEPTSHEDGDGPSERDGPDDTDESSGTEPSSPPRERFDIDSDRILLTVTNLKYRAKYRGVTTAVSELESVLERRPDTAYVVAGGGEYAGKLESRLDALVTDPDVRDRIHAVGYVTDVASLYEIADVFVYVSYLDGYPRVVLEAQRAGVPVVANDAFGMREQIVDGESGFLVDLGATGQLAGRVEFLLENDEDRREHGRRGRERVASENSPSAVGERLEAFVRTLHEDHSRDR